MRVRERARSRARKKARVSRERAKERAKEEEKVGGGEREREGESGSVSARERKKERERARACAREGGYSAKKEAIFQKQDLKYRPVITNVVFKHIPPFRKCGIVCFRIHIF